MFARNLVVLWKHDGCLAKNFAMLSDCFDNTIYMFHLWTIVNWLYYYSSMRNLGYDILCDEYPHVIINSHFDSLRQTFSLWHCSCRKLTCKWISQSWQHLWSFRQKSTEGAALFSTYVAQHKDLKSILQRMRKSK